MANARLVAVLVAILVILLEVSTCAMARHHGKPYPCSSSEDDGSMAGTLHKHKKRGHCRPSRGGTPAVMTMNGFQKGESGGGPSACDGRYHSDKELIVALSTRWYAGGRRCHKPIRITSRQNGRTVEAIVVDECDSNNGCKDNIVDTSEAVWKTLGLNSNIGVVPVTWSDAGPDAY
jgi:hypothetical protein